MENKKIMIEKNLQSFLKIIDPKISHISPEEINLDEEKKEVNIFPWFYRFNSSIKIS